MKCPVCGSELLQKRFGDIHVDFCGSCKGVWVATDKLDDLIIELLETRDIPDAPLDIEKDVVRVADLDEGARMCPVCGREMRKFNYAYDSNIILDKCEECGGVWADDGEIMRLAVFRKGNPILDRLADAIAENSRERVSVRLDSASQRGGGWYAFAPKFILPMGDDLESSSFPFVTAAIALLNVVVFVWQWFFLGGDTAQAFFKRFGLVPANAFAGWEHLPSFLTSMFIHVGLFHLFGNMLFLFIFADNIEDKLGHAKFLGLYLLFGLAADFTHILSHPDSLIPTIGASGAISGIMGAYFVIFPAAKIKTYVYGKIMDIPAWFFLGTWFTMQIIFSQLAKSNPLGGGVAWTAHLGGFVAGVAIALFFRFFPKKRSPLGEGDNEAPTSQIQDSDHTVK